MRLVRAALLSTLFVGSAHADGDSLTDMLGPREIAVGEAGRGAATGGSAIGLNPAGLPLSRDMVFEGGYGYRMSDSASIFGLSACDSTGALPGCFYYDYAGASPTDPTDGMSGHTHMHVAGSALAYPLTPRVFLGAGLKYFHFDSDMMTQPSSSGVNWDLGATLRLTDIINVGVAGYNLYGADSSQFPRALGGGVVARPIPILALDFDARWKLNYGGGMRYGGGAELFMRTSSGQTGFPIRAGALHDTTGTGTTFLSAGLGIAAMKYGIDLAARHAISGSNETLVIASMRFYGPRLRGPALDVAGE